MQYNIIEFLETKTAAVVPTNWINNDELKWNDEVTPLFNKKWKTYKIKLLTSLLFDKYEDAEAAMKRILDINKIDIDTDDDLIPETEDKTHRKSSTSSSSSEDELDNLLKMIKPRENLTDNIEESPDSKEFLVNDMNNIINDTHIKDKSSSVLQNVQIGSKVALDGSNENSYVLIPQNILDNILHKLSSLEKSVKTIERYITKDDITCSCKKTDNFKNRFSETLPLQNVQNLMDFDEQLSNDETLITGFKKYLTANTTARDLRSFVRTLVNKVYCMDLQGKINFSGVKGKTKLKDLISTDVILHTVCELVPELILIKDESEKFRKAESEFKYQLQHFYDRKRSADRYNVFKEKKGKHSAY